MAEGRTSSIEHRTMGDLIRGYRVAKRLRQEDAAFEADISVHEWSNLENDHVDDPRLSTLQRVASTLGVDLGALIPADKYSV